jgi:hypothetical protein
MTGPAVLTLPQEEKTFPFDQTERKIDAHDPEQNHLVFNYAQQLRPIQSRIPKSPQD